MSPLRAVVIPTQWTSFMFLVSNVNILFHSLHKMCTIVTCQLSDPLPVSQSFHHVPHVEFSGALPAV